jgi:glyoxylase-like metal-dependent hydrolase (beta-lactamase superfamily II)
MLMIKIASNVWKLNVDSNVYLVKLNDWIVIDTGLRAAYDTVNSELSKIVNLKDVKKVILTHIHYDHAGNVDLFPNASIYASKREIEDFKINPLVGFNLNPKIIMFLRENLKPIEEVKLSDFEVINVPGHTAGSIALFYKKEKILFSGDCLFENGIGRYDLPNSIASEMENSLDKLKKIKYKILAPGHDY